MYAYHIQQRQTSYAFFFNFSMHDDIMAQTVLYDVLLIVKYVKTQTECVLVNQVGWVNNVSEVISIHELLNFLEYRIMPKTIL